MNLRVHRASPGCFLALPILKAMGLVAAHNMLTHKTPCRPTGGPWLIVPTAFYQHLRGPWPAKKTLGSRHLGDGQSMQFLSLSLISSTDHVRAAVFVGFGIDDFGKEPSSDCYL